MKKSISVLLAILTIISIMTGLNLTAYAAGSTFDAATSINLNQSYSGTINDSNRVDYYKFTLSTSGAVSIPVTQYIYRYNCYIYDANQKELFYNTMITKSDSNVASETKTVFDVNLVSGTYYFRVVRQDSNYNGNYSFKINFTSANESFKESLTKNDDGIDYANSINLNTNYNGQIASTETYDYYKFVLPTSGLLNVSITQYVYQYNWHIYDSNKKEITGDYHVTKSSPNAISETHNDYNYDLLSGTYYFCIEKDYSSKTGNYNFILSFTSSEETFAESATSNNDSMNYASAITTGKEYKGQIAKQETYDWYKFTIASSCSIKMNITQYLKQYNWHIYDSNKKEIASDYHVSKSSSNAKSESNSYQIDLSAGTYYLCIEKDYSSSTGNYSFKISASNWVNSSGKWYYQTDGKNATGWQKINDVWYYFNSSGVMQTGWLKSGNKWYFLKNSGAMATGWVKSGGKWYYMNASGAMLTGWVKDSGNWYFMNSDGSMYTGWLKRGGNWYYLQSSGVMCKSGTYKINGTNYHFDSNGVWDR